MTWSYQPTVTLTRCCRRSLEAATRKHKKGGIRCRKCGNALTIAPAKKAEPPSPSTGEPSVPLPTERNAWLKDKETTS